MLSPFKPSGMPGSVPSFRSAKMLRPTILPAASSLIAWMYWEDRVDVLGGSRVRHIHRAFVRRQREPVRVFARCQHAQSAVRRQTINACAIPEIVFPRRAGDLALVVGAALVRVGEVEAAVRVADHVVWSIDAPAFVVVDQGFHRAVRAHPGNAPVISFADDQTALQVEGRAVSANGGPDE